MRGYGSVGRAMRSQCIGQGFESPYLHHKKSIRFDTKVLNLFSLHKRSSFLSVRKYQSLVGVFNRTFAGLFSLYIITTERKVYQRNDRYCYGTIGFLMNFIKNK